LDEGKSGPILWIRSRLLAWAGYGQVAMNMMLQNDYSPHDKSMLATSIKF